MLRKVLSRVNTRRALGDCVGLEPRPLPPPLFCHGMPAPVFMIGGGGGGGFGCVANFVDSMRICNALFSPVLVGCHVQGGVE
jgi:hypothetical protein